MSQRTTPHRPVDTLSQLDLFSQCRPSEMRRVRSLTSQTDVPAGTTLCRQGTYGREAFIALEGQAQVERDGASIATVEPGAVIGEMALLGGRFRTATVRATTPMRVLVLQPAEFRALLGVSPSIAEKVTEAARRHGAPADPGDR